MKLYDGMRVRGSIHGLRIEGGVIAIKNSDYYFCQNEREGNDCKDKKGFKYSWVFSQLKDGSFTSGVKLEPLSDGVTLTPLSDDIEGIYEGAVIVNSAGNNRRKVLGICGEMVFLSIIDNFDDASITNVTIKELKKARYKLELPKQIRKVTMKEVIEKFGETVEIEKEG